MSEGANLLKLDELGLDSSTTAEEDDMTVEGAVGQVLLSTRSSQPSLHPLSESSGFLDLIPSSLFFLSEVLESSLRISPSDFERTA